MFLQVAVPKDECKFLRFLWRPKPTQTVDVYEYKRHVFGARSSPTCVIYAPRKAAEDSKNHFPQALKFVQRNFYMDDIIMSVPSEPEATSVFDEINSCLKKGFKIKKWICSSKRMMSQIPIELQSDAKTTNN